MHPCPHCRHPAFTDSQKLLQLWWRPQLCPQCHKGVFLPVRHLVIALIVWTLLGWVFIGTAVYMRNVLFLLGTLPAGFFAADLWIRKAPLQCYDNNSRHGD